MTASPRCYAFGPYVLNLGRGILLRHGTRVPTTPRILHLLEVLVTHAGEVLDKDDLIRQVWGGTIVEENNLARQISSLRKVLGETPGSCDYIATVPGVGYRFVAPVTGVEPGAELAALMPPRPPRWRWDHLLEGAVAMIAVAAVAAFVSTRRERTASNAAPVQRSIRQFTFGAGLQQDPAWSPDGRRLAFASDRLGSQDIWVERVGDTDAARVTSWPSREWEPDWSPDGRMIAFRSDHNGSGLYVVSSGGGEPRRISSFGRRPQWSPAGDWILFSNASVRTGTRRLYVVAPDGGALREVCTGAIEPFISSAWASSVEAAWHPDGRRVSLWGRIGDRWALVTVPVFGGPETSSAIPDAVLRDIEDSHLKLGRFIWAPSGRYLFFEGESGETHNVWRVGVDPATLAWTGATERLTTDVGEERDIALSSDGGRLAFTVRSQRTRLWSFGFDPQNGRLGGDAHPLTAGSAAQVDVDTLRDGSRLAYRAVQAGRSEVRELQPGSSEDRVLLVSNDWSPSSPRWSSDGRRLAYSRPSASGTAGAGKNVVAVLSTDERREQLVSLPGDAILRPSDWSSDGKTLLGDCRVSAGEAMAICSIPAPGSGQQAGALRVLFRDPQKNLYGPRFSPDHRWVSFVAVDTRGSSSSRIYVAPASGGPWVTMTDGQSFADKPRWAPDGRTVYFISDRDGHLNLRGRKFEPDAGAPAGETFSVTSFESPRRGLPANIKQIEFAIAEHRLFLPLTETEGDVWILDDVDR